MLPASRTAEFSYYTSGHRKGLLKTEVREPNKAGLKHTTTYDYDKFGHRIQAAGTPVTHRYDAWGQVVATVTGTGDAAVTVAWAYDLRGRRVKETDPNRGVTHT